jgi:predicted acyl esterase
MLDRSLSFHSSIAMLGGLLALAAVAHAQPTDYVAMSDRVLIAINLQFPSGDAPAGGWPTIIQIDGYAGGSSPMNPNSKTFGNGNYATVHMSLRGTGCSGGQFDLFDRRSSEDGKGGAQVDWRSGLVQ